MSKPRYKAIILVLASHDWPIYHFFREMWRTYLDHRSDIKVFLFYGKGSGLEPTDHDLIFENIAESYKPGMAQKTLAAMEYINENFDYDFCIRTNISTFWDLDGLAKFLDTIPKENCFTGEIGIFPPEFIGGQAMVMSRDIVQKMVENKDQVLANATKEAEDRLLNYYIQDTLKIPLLRNIIIFRIEKITGNNIEAIRHEIRRGQERGVISFRIKNICGVRDLKESLPVRLTTDPYIAQELCSIYYNKKIDYVVHSEEHA